MPPVITLTTDFGLADPFVGIMKGVILNILPSARLVDVTHQIEPQNILQAALVLKAAHAYFPKNTVHLVVVDPGVGGERRPIAVKTGTAVFVAPDNGILTSVLCRRAQAYELTNKKYFLKNPSSTFHGRDIFAPASAWIARGTPLSKLGRKITDPETLELARPVLKQGIISGEVIYIDRFGNLTTNITQDLLNSTLPQADSFSVKLGGKQVSGLVSSYSRCKRGTLGCLINSWDHLEIFRREASAAEMLKARVGQKVTVVKVKSKK